jgi:hypothetical protein
VPFGTAVESQEKLVDGEDDIRTPSTIKPTFLTSLLIFTVAVTSFATVELASGEAIFIGLAAYARP